MSGRSLRLAIGVLGTVWAVAGEAIAMSAGRSASSGLLHLAIGLTYLYGGLAIWDHEPANRTGRLMTLVGLTWFIGTLDDCGDPDRQRDRPGARGHLDGHPRRARPGLPERQARDARRSGRRRDPGDRRHHAQHPLLDEPPAHRGQEQRSVRWPGARDAVDRRRRPALADRPAPHTSRAGAGPRRGRGLPRRA